MRLFHVPVECLKIELHLAQMFRLELDDFEFNGDQTVETAIEKQQVQREVSPPNLDWVLAADVTEVTAKLDQEFLELFNQPRLQVPLGMFRRKVEKLDKIAVLKDRCRVRVQFSQRW